MTFATSTVMSFALACCGLGSKYGDLESIDITSIPAQLGILLLSLVVCLVSWHWNDQRAKQFHVPVLSIVDMLQHANSRLRVLAVMSIPLLPPNSMTPQDAEKAIDIMRLLLSSSVCTHEGYLKAYTCRALVHLLRHADIAQLAMPQREECVAPGLWLIYLKPEMALHLHLRASHHAGSRHKHLVECAGRLNHKVVDGNLDLFSTPSALEDFSACLRQVVQNALELSTCAYINARMEACRLLMEMYNEQLVQLNVPEFLNVVSTLCADIDETTSYTACSVLATFVRMEKQYLNDHTEVLTKLVVSRIGILCISTLLESDVRSMVYDSALVLHRLLKMVQFQPDWVNDCLSKLFIERLLHAFRQWKTYEISIFLEEMVDIIQRSETKVVEGSLAVGNSLNVAMLKFQKRKHTIQQTPRKSTKSHNPTTLRNRPKSFMFSPRVSPILHDSVFPIDVLEEIEKRRQDRLQLQELISPVLSEHFAQNTSYARVRTQHGVSIQRASEMVCDNSLLKSFVSCNYPQKQQMYRNSLMHASLSTKVHVVSDVRQTIGKSMSRIASFVDRGDA